jgi:hypothetical protein
MLSFMAWLCLKDNALTGSQIAIKVRKTDHYDEIGHMITEYYGIIEHFYPTEINNGKVVIESTLL